MNESYAYETWLTNVPTYSMLICMRSPSFNNRGGDRDAPIPRPVPVRMTVPFYRVVYNLSRIILSVRDELAWKAKEERR